MLETEESDAAGADEEEQQQPVVVPKSALKKTTNGPGAKKIVLSMRETMNLLEPDTRVFARSEVMELTPDAIDAVTAKVLTPWHARCGELARFHMPPDEGEKVKGAIKAPRGAMKKKTAGAAAAADGEDGAGEEEDNDNQLYVEKDFILSFPYSEVPIQPGTMAVRHELKKYATMPANSWLFSSNGFVDSARTAKVQSRMFGRAVQQIGHRVLAGNCDILGGMVSKPMMVAADGAPTPPALEPGELDWGAAPEFDKKLLDASAVVYAEWSRHTEHYVPRLTEVDLQRCTLAQYIAALEQELVHAHAVKAVKKKKLDANGKVLKDDKGQVLYEKESFEKRDIIVGVVESMLAVARSYTTAKHATNYVLPPGPHDPNNVVLEMHVHRIIPSVDIANSDIFDNAFTVPEKSKAADPSKRVKETCEMLAKKDNTTRMVFTFSIIDGEPGEEAESVSKIMIVTKVPIVPFNRYLRELETGMFAERMCELVGDRLKKRSTTSATSTVAIEEGADGEKSPPTKTPAKAKHDEDDDIDDKPLPTKSKAKPVPVTDDEEAVPAKPTPVKSKPAPKSAPTDDDDEVVPTPAAKTKAKPAPKPAPVDDDEPTPVKAKAKSSAMDEDDTPPPPKRQPKAVDNDAMDADEVAKVIAGAAKKKVTLITPAKVKIEPPKTDDDDDDEADDAEEEKTPVKKATPTKAAAKPEPPAKQEPPKVAGKKRPADAVEDETPEPPPASVTVPVTQPVRTAPQQKLLELLSTKVGNYGDTSKSETVRYGPFAEYDGGTISEMPERLRVAFTTACHLMQYTQLPALLTSVVAAEKSLVQAQKKSKKEPAGLASTLGVDQEALDMLGD